MKNRVIKILTISLISFVLLTAALTGLFLIWTADYYHAENDVIDALKKETKITYTDNFMIFKPSVPNGTGIIFYPGAKVEHTAYSPLLIKLKNEGFTCVLIKMPGNMAFPGADKADEVYEKVPEIKSWFIAGHSLGGAMASRYAAENKDKVQGLILLGAYIYGDYPVKKSLTVYGTFNSNLEKNITYSENIVIIEGGNHAQFGNYGKQKGDPDATISAEEQQRITVEAITKFIQSQRGEIQ